MKKNNLLFESNLHQLCFDFIVNALPEQKENRSSLDHQNLRIRSTKYFLSETEKNSVVRNTRNFEVHSKRIYSNIKSNESVPKLYEC